MKDRWEVREVPNQKENVIHDNKEGGDYDLYEVLTKILNKIEDEN